MATIVEINHDSSTTIGDHYDSVTDTDGAITVSAAARLDISVYGVAMAFGAGTNTVILIKNISSSTGEFRFRFRIKLDNVTNSNSGALILRADIQGDGNNPNGRIDVNGNSGDGGFNIQAFYTSDGKGASLTQIGSGNDAISSTGEVCLEFSVITNSPGDTDFAYYINGTLAQSVAGVTDKDIALIDTVQIEISSSDANVTGTLYYDEYIIDNTFDASGLCTDSVDPYALVLGGGHA